VKKDVLSNDSNHGGTNIVSYQTKFPSPKKINIKISTYNPKKKERKKEKVKRIVRGRVNDQQYHFQS